VQVHTAANRPQQLRESDVQMTSDATLVPLVVVADCFPLALCAPGAVAMAHCGWRGTAGGVVPNGVDAVCRAAGDRPGDVHAALGPGIGPCCYEVGEEVADAFRRAGYEDALGAGRLDLAAVIGAELERCGVDGGRFVHSRLCTSCNRPDFFSHRRDAGVTGRQAGLVWLDR
jgi:YfiH family protein